MGIVLRHRGTTRSTVKLPRLYGSEVVSCYDLNTGDIIWSHDDPARFEEPMAGPGPRATPTFADGKLYAMKARGKLNCLNPATGEVIWSHDVTADTGRHAVPHVGFLRFSTGYQRPGHGHHRRAKGSSVIAYDALTGKRAWAAGDGWSYASVHLARLDGVDQLLAVTAAGLTSLDPQHGQILWTHDFNIGGTRNCVIQPTLLNGNDILLGAAFGIGTRKIHITHSGNTWNQQTVWTTKSIKPYYNDVVVHRGNLYGFDGSASSLASTRKPEHLRWRRYHEYGITGRCFSLPTQNLLLVISETGEAALVDAKPEEFHELGRFQAVNGKTWNSSRQRAW